MAWSVGARCEGDPDQGTGVKEAKYNGVEKPELESADAGQRIPVDPFVAVFEMPDTGGPQHHGHGLAVLNDDLEEPVIR